MARRVEKVAGCGEAAYSGGGLGEKVVTGGIVVGVPERYLFKICRDAIGFTSARPRHFSNYNRKAPKRKLFLSKLNGNELIVWLQGQARQYF